MVDLREIVMDRDELACWAQLGRRRAFRHRFHKGLRHSFTLDYEGRLSP